MLAQTAVKIRGEPTADPQRCRFVLETEVLSRSSVTFKRDSDTENAPLAQKLLELPYIAEVNITGQVVTLTGDNVESWPALGKEIGTVIREQIESGEPAVTVAAMDVGNSDLFKEVEDLIKADVNPSIASHGGVITLQSVSDGKAYVTMGGGCQGCGMADVTLKQGNEVEIKGAVPSIAAVLDVTDHAGGDNPYYSPGKGGPAPY
jgi:Fe-S cluster biogenesis protein NfuA